MRNLSPVTMKSPLAAIVNKWQMKANSYVNELYVVLQLATFLAWTWQYGQNLMKTCKELNKSDTMSKIISRPQTAQEVHQRNLQKEWYCSFPKSSLPISREIKVKGTDPLTC